MVYTDEDSSVRGTKHYPGSTSLNKTKMTLPCH